MAMTQFKLWLITMSPRQLSSLLAPKPLQRIEQGKFYGRTSLVDLALQLKSYWIEGHSTQELHNHLGIQTFLSTAYHLQTHSQMERVNYELDLALCIYCGNDPDHWEDHLKEVKLAHNQ